MKDIVIVGAGIVGLATALKILEKNPNIKLAILEKEQGPAKHQTGNNSGVIHAGVYYKPGSLKAQNCIRGYKLLLDFCNKESVKYDLCGKLIIASEIEELSRLDDLYIRARQNGLEKVTKMTGERIQYYEPHAYGLEAMHVPYTGIINYKELCFKYIDILEKRFGVEFYYNSELTEVVKKYKGVELITQAKSFEAKFLINTAGLYSDKVTLMTQESLEYRIIPFRGEYSQLRDDRKHLVKNLIYPVPDPKFPFLGVHFTRTINGNIELGPNAIWAFKQEGYSKYSFNTKDVLRAIQWPGFRKVLSQYWTMGMEEYWRSLNKLALAKALSRLVPEISAKDIVSGGSGVRAQACDRHGGLVDDFLIIENEWAINVINAPSPAATASLAVGETIADLALKRM